MSNTQNSALSRLSTDDRIVSLPEAAHLVGVSPDTLRRCHKRQELKIIKLSPRRIGIRLSDLNAFIEARAL